MGNAATVAIGISARDRDGNKAKITCYAPWSLDLASLWAIANGIADRINAISDAIIFKIDITWRYRDDNAPMAPEGIDMGRKLLVLVINDDGEIAAIIIPASADVFEITGNYAGIRADLTNEDIAHLQDAISRLNYRTSDNRPLGRLIAAAGLML